MENAVAAASPDAEPHKLVIRSADRAENCAEFQFFRRQVATQLISVLQRHDGAPALGKLNRFNARQWNLELAAGLSP